MKNLIKLAKSNSLPFIMMIVSLFIWSLWGNGNGHLNQSNTWDYLALATFIGGLILLVKRNWL